MVTICVIVGIILLVGGIIIAYITRSSGSSIDTSTPPTLPSRRDTGVALLSTTHTRTHTSRPVSTPSVLPPRRNMILQSTYTAHNSIEPCCGPRGVQPVQFPCCPYDKQRNVPGERQLIFWDRSANCYYCSRGHKFKSNGKLLLAN